jgi:hypothetical protein
VSVIITLDTGQAHGLDRNCRLDRVAETINGARGEGKLVPFQNNATPTRTFYVDPDHVVSITDDGHPY